MNGHTYGFISVATDLLGNQQPTPTSAQATTLVQASSDVTGSISQTLYGGTYNRFTRTQYMTLVLTNTGPADLYRQLAGGSAERHGVGHGARLHLGDH